jgi:hypothetical protein
VEGVFFLLPMIALCKRSRLTWTSTSNHTISKFHSPGYSSSHLELNSTLLAIWCAVIDMQILFKSFMIVSKHACILHQKSLCNYYNWDCYLRALFLDFEYAEFGDKV